MLSSTGSYGRGTGYHYHAGHVDIESTCYGSSIQYTIFHRYKANTHCRLKCNRAHPCDNCVRRGDSSSCSYAAPGTRKKNQAQASNSPDDMQNRIDRLESLVLSLMTNGTQSAGPAAAIAAISRSTSSSGPSPGQPLEQEHDNDDMIKEEEEESDEDISSTFGALKVDNEKGKSTYFGDNHWHMVLADVSVGGESTRLDGLQRYAR